MRDRCVGFAAIAVAFALVLPLIPTAEASALAVTDGPVNKTDDPRCIALLDRLSNLDHCAREQRLGVLAVASSVRAVTNDDRPIAVVVATANHRRVTVIGDLVEAEVAKDDCASFSLTEVYGDPTSDWDDDGLTNISEVYNGTDPCTFSVVEETPPVVLDGVVGDQVEQLLSSATVAPAVVDAPEADTATDTDVSVEPSGNVLPCPTFSTDDVLADPNTDWDNDGAANGAEFYNNQNPCVFDAALNDATRGATPDPSAASPCPSYSART